MDAEPCDGGLPGSDGMPDDEAVGIDGADEDDDDDDELGIEGIDEDDDEEEELGIDGIDEDEDEELGIDGAEGADEDDEDELGIEGMPLLLELCCVDSQAERIKASADAPIKATTRYERR